MRPEIDPTTQSLEKLTIPQHDLVYWIICILAMVIIQCRRCWTMRKAPNHAEALETSRALVDETLPKATKIESSENTVLHNDKSIQCSKIQTLSQALSLKKQNLEACYETYDTQSVELSQLEEVAGKKDKEIAELRRYNTALRDESNKATNQTQADHHECQLEINQKDAAITGFQHDRSSLQAQVQRLRTQLTICGSKADERRTKTEDMLTEIGEWEGKVKTLQRRNRLLGSELAEADARIVGLQSQMKKLEYDKQTELDKLQAEYNKLEDDCDYLQEDKDKLVDTVERLAAEHDDSGSKGSKSVMILSKPREGDVAVQNHEGRMIVQEEAEETRDASPEVDYAAAYNTSPAEWSMSDKPSDNASAQQKGSSTGPSTFVSRSPLRPSAAEFFPSGIYSAKVDDPSVSPRPVLRASAPVFIPAGRDVS